MWFRAKRYGWGWRPVTWQGWAVVAVWVAAFSGWLAYRIGTGLPTAWFRDWPTVLGAAALIAGLAVVCWKRGERPGGR